MIPLIIGAAIAAAGAVGKGIAQSRARKKMNLYLDKREKEAKDDYNNSLGKSAASQQAETQQDKQFQEGLQAINNSINDSPLKRAQALEALAEGRALQRSQNAVNDEQMRMQAKAQYQARKDAIDNQRFGMEQQASDNAAQAWGAVSQAGLSIVGSEMGNALQGAGAAKVGTGTGTGTGTGIANPGLDSATQQKIGNLDYATMFRDFYKKQLSNYPTLQRIKLPDYNNLS